jgi:transmembrane sensor
VTKEELKNIIKKSCSEKDSAAFARWVISDSFENDLDSFITDDLENELTQIHQVEDKALEKMAAKILRTNKYEILNPVERAERIISPYKSDWQTRSWFSSGYKIAAAMVLLAAFSFVVFYFINRQSEDVTSAQIITKENLRGRKSTIFLKDGSVVYLNAESKIHFPEVFSDSLREIQLEGEAYFDIAKDEARPFIVSIGELKISVLGTSFNVHAYDDTEFIKVSLISGKVRVESGESNDYTDNGKVQLVAGQSVSYSKKQNTFTKVSTFNPALDAGWKDGTIVFENASMENMLQRFGRWYNVDFEIKNAPAFQWNYTGEFGNQTLQDVLESLSFSQKFEYKINKDKVEIMFNPN